MPMKIMLSVLTVAILLKWTESAALNTSITLSQLENSDSFATVSDGQQQQPRQGRQTTNGFLPGLQRVPLSFQGFLGSGDQDANSGIGGVGSLTNGLDLETFTKNQAIRANQENAIVAQLSNMASVRKNQLARDISGGNVSATNELISNLMRDLAVSPAGNMAFPSFADRASVLSSENFGGQSTQQQQLMLARMLAEEQLLQQPQQRTFSNNNGPQQQQPDLNRMLQLQALNGDA
uniref:Uncharacterized protein n=1 Tax=Ditylenchus dipsaci TaxID=166011 RepID=A0A915DE91_9BILA